MALSAAALQAFLGFETDEVALVLITFSHASLTTPIRVVSNEEDVTSRSNTFTAFPFDISLPSDSEGPPTATLRIANVDRTIGTALDGIVTPVEALIEIVLASSLETVEASWDNFELINVQLDAVAVEGELVVRSRTSEPWPNINVVPNKFAALFAAVG